jgi:hypothetical protein
MTQALYAHMNNKKIKIKKKSQRLNNRVQLYREIETSSIKSIQNPAKGEKAMKN